MTSTPAEHEARVKAAANNLRIDAATAEVLKAFADAEIASVLLKGPALSDWYAGDRARTYVDCDLWVPTSALERAGKLLTGLGFARLADERGLPDWWLEHASSWSRVADAVEIDLHRTLQGIGVDANVAWDALFSSTETVVVGGYPASILAPAARALYVTLHAAHHGKDWGKALIHLERALSLIDRATWLEAAALAQRLEASDAFATGLRLLPEGATLADRLGLPMTASARVALHASSPPPVALGLEQLAQAESTSARVRILARKLVPPPGFVRHWWPPAARNRRMLALAYMYRPLWLLRRAPSGFRAWRDARRQVRAGR